MGDKTGIGWTDATWSPVVGCSKASTGCTRCYAASMSNRLSKMPTTAEKYADLVVRPEGKPWEFNGTVRCYSHLLDQPYRWKRPRKIFVCSMSDLFHKEVPDDFIAEVFAVMAASPQHIFQVLTKRPDRMARLLNDPTFVSLVVYKAAATYLAKDFSWPISNVWVGTSIENNRFAARADSLRLTPAAVRWISAEPLLGPLDLVDLTDIDWVVVGGESGAGARPLHPQWVRDLRDRCQLADCETCYLCDGAIVLDEPDARRGDPGFGEYTCDDQSCSLTVMTVEVPSFFFKQWGAYGPIMVGESTEENDGGCDLVQLDGRHSWAGSMGEEYLSNWIGEPPTDGFAWIKKGRPSDNGNLLDGHHWEQYP